ncbi:MAG: hypothetical protein ABI175_23550, partial [Polyangiales bacterium]
MKRAAVGLLVATTLGGCNQIFGLEATTALPDAAPPDAFWSSIQLGFLQLTFDPAMAVPDPAIVPFPDLSRVEVGTLDGPLVMRAADATGMITVPLDITMAGPFRLVYQRTGDPVVHEYQGLMPDAKVIEPLWGPIARPVPPLNGGFLISPTNTPTNHTQNRVFTIGTWTEGKQLVQGAGAPTLDYDYSPPSTISMSGPFGATAATDRGVLVDYETVGTCRRAIGSADFPAGGLAAPHPTVMGIWTQNDTVTRSSTTPLAFQFPADIHPFGEGNLSQHEHYGFVPSDAMPAFTRAPDLVGREVALPNPVMVALRVCSSLDNNAATLAVHDPLLLKERLDPALYTEVTVERQLASGPFITNGFAALTLGTTGYQVQPNIAFAKNASLLSTSNVTTNLWDGDEAVLALGGTLTL